MNRFLGALVAALTLLPTAAAGPLGDFGDAAQDACLLFACVGDAPVQVNFHDSYDSSGEPHGEDAAPREDGHEREESTEAAQEDEPAPEREPRHRGDGSLLGGAFGVVREAVPLEELPVDLEEALGLAAPLSALPAFDEPAAAPSSGPAPMALAAASVPREEGSPASAVVVLTPAAAMVAAAIVAANPAATFGWERLRRFGLFALLYTRIAKERLLDHGRREELLDAIRSHPGKAVADLVEITGVPRNTVVYHLMRLEREGLVSSKREGRTRLYFAPGSLEQRAHAEALAALRHDTSRAIALEIGAQPGLDQHALCQKFGIAASLAHWHADRLVSSGVVEKRREGRHVRYYPGEAFSLVKNGA